MSRKSRKGYYVNGEFVIAGSDADQQAHSELEDPSVPSRTALKNASEEIQKLGEELLELREDRLTKLSLPEGLEEAVFDARRMTKFGARRRQTKLIGKLMRRLDPEVLEAVGAALRAEQGQTAKDAAFLNRAEQWRDALLADDEVMERWIAEFPGTDAQQLRSLVRQARKDVKEAKPREAERHGRSYRQIFKVLLSQIQSSADTPLR